MTEFNVTCLEGGGWEEPLEWPVCYSCEYRRDTLIDILKGTQSRARDKPSLLPEY